MQRRVLALGAVSVFACAQPVRVAPQPTPTKTPVPPLTGLHFDIGAIDPHANPCSDFYDYACGGWRATHPIPPDQTRWSRYAEMTAVNGEHERAIVEEATRAGANASPAERRVGAYYAACMDEQGIETRGLAPIRELLASIDAIRTKADALAVIADFHAHDIEAVFSVFGETDPDDAKQIVTWIDKGSLGLLDPGDYSKKDDASVARRARYVEHLGRLFRLLGATADEAKLSASRVLAFETSLAEKALTAVERRNNDATHHSMSLAELTKRFSAIDWRSYFTKIGAPAIDRANVAQPAWLDAANVALSAKDSSGMRAYLRILAARASAPVLPRAIEEEVFDFRQRTLRGAREMAPRWKRCLKEVDGDIGDDVGRIFVERYFKADARARMKTMVDALIAAYRADIASSNWLGAPAREAATAKLANMLVVIGASNRPRSFDALRVEKDDAFGNAWRAQALTFADNIATIGKPTDREKFFESLPQTTDGFGSKSKNATGFTAGFLQPPVFDPRMDDAVNYGGLGSVIGHELSHRFDDEGRKFDAEGNLRSWWSPDDIARFEERAQCFIDEYSHFHTEEGTPLDGKLTLGENIADNGGIRLSYAALERRPRAFKPRPIRTPRGDGASMASSRTCRSSRARSRAQLARQWRRRSAARFGNLSS